MDPTGQRLRNKGTAPRGWVTVNGEVRIERRHYHSATAGTSTPLDRLLDLAEATVSLGVREMACRLNGGATSFVRAAENLRRVGQVPMSGEKLRQVVEAEGRQVQAVAQAEQLQAGWQARDCRTDGQAARVYVSTDGFMVPLVTTAEKQARRQQVKHRRQQRGKKARPLGRLRPGADQRYKEFKAVAFYDQTREHRLVAVTRGDCQALGRLMRRDAQRIGFYGATQRIGNIDGGPWARKQVQRRLRVTALGLDFFHFSENAHKARRVIFGEESETGRAVTAGWLHAVKQQGYTALWDQLVEQRHQLRSPAKRRALDQFMHYASDRREMIRSPEFLAQGWQIGSGPMESQCRVIPQRVKGPGKRWDADHAEAVMALEALDQSNRWSAYWQLALAGSH